MMGWSAALARDGDFRGVSDGRFLTAYLGIPLVRLQIIDCLRARGSVTRPHLARLLGWTTGGLRAHLEVLEDIGLIESTRVRVPSSFKPVTSYRLNAGRLRDVAGALERTLSGADWPAGVGDCQPAYWHESSISSSDVHPARQPGRSASAPRGLRQQ